MCLQYKPLFDKYLVRGDRPLSCYHFAAVFAWKDFFNFEFQEIDDRLCVFANTLGQPDDRFLYLPPLGGPITSSIIKECLKRMSQSRIARVENISHNQLPVLGREDYNVHLKAREYLYSRQDLIKLAGGAYKSQRHDLHVFARKYASAQYRAYGLADYPACLALFKCWSAKRKAKPADPVYLAMLEDNAVVHALLMEHAQSLGLLGRVVVLDGNIIGYTFGYALDEQTFCVLLEVTDLSLTGLAVFIFNRFCADPMLQDFEWINTMDAFGLPEVATTKRAYRPCRLLPVYTIRKFKEAHAH